MRKAKSTLISMTGFSRTTGTWRDLTWAWELKSVNGKSLDLRFRLPTGYDALEAAARALGMTKLKRGNVQINLSVQSTTPQTNLKVNDELLEQVVSIAETLRDRLGSAPIQAENLLLLRGVLDTGEAELSDDDTKLRDAALLQSFTQAIDELVAARGSEGSRLSVILTAQLDRIEELNAAATANPSRSVEAIRLRISEQVARLLEQSDSFDPQRLHQEAILLATRADIQEELDRLTSHITAARSLMASSEPVGRKFDFLTQEFNREANTLCSKASDASLTAYWS